MTMLTRSTPTRATLTARSGPHAQDNPLEVHFNPASLTHIVENRISPGRETTQYVSSSSATLSMELVFDTTHSGEDVRLYTNRLLLLMEPGAEPSANRRAVSTVRFEWGSFNFEGVISRCQQTIDFFSAEGVPLRATASISLTCQSSVFPDNAQAGANPNAIEVNSPNGGFGVTGLAQAGGDVRAGRAIAAANGMASMRFSGGASLVVSGGDGLQGPAAFASGGAGISLGAGVSAGAGLSVGGGLSAGAGLRAGAAAGGQMSAGVSASAGAFSGLRTTTQASTTARLNPSRLVQGNLSTGFATDSQANFQMGGRATTQASVGLRANLGSEVSLASRLQFDE